LAGSASFATLVADGAGRGTFDVETVVSGAWAARVPITVADATTPTSTPAAKIATPSLA
jgi:hypothetical protein